MRFYVMCLISLVCLLIASEVRAEEYEVSSIGETETSFSLLIRSKDWYQPSPVSERYTTETRPSPKKAQGWFGIRLNTSHTFSDEDMEDFYGGEVSASGLDLTFDTDLNVSWIISLDMRDGGAFESASYYIGWDWYGDLTYAEDFSFTGLSASVIGRSLRKEKFQLYGGAGLGFYTAEADGELTDYETYWNGSYWEYNTYSLSVSGDGTGMGFKLLGGFDIALSPQVLLGLRLEMLFLEIDMGGFEDVDFGSTTIDLGLNLTF